ncbi:MAG: PIG-L family deacetylase [Acetatifactor sp.]
MKKLLTGFALLLLLTLTPAITSEAAELTPTTSKAGKTITVEATDGSKIGAVYIKWNAPVAPYEIETETGTISCGQNGFLHEFIPLEQKSTSLTILLPEQPMGIYEIRIFEDTNVPDDVQIWQPPCERADIMMISAHSDDEILFMGGIIPAYAAEYGASVQVVYMTEFWSTAPVREHEKLDGLWTDGLRNYPVCLNLVDKYASNLEEAKKIYDLGSATEALTDMIRRFQPQVVVTHDFNGEYGHGFHMFTATATAAALDAAADDTVRNDTEIYQAKGAWDVPKAYFHLYPENSIHMNLRIPLESMGGKTALEVAKEAYLKHVSQQWCWFYVDDTYEYSCADFGLYRTRVGYDNIDSMLDNIVIYSEQERLEQERLEQERLEQERLEQERLEQERLERERVEQERLAAEKQQEEQLALETAARKRNTILLIILIVVAVIAVIMIVPTVRRRQNSKKRHGRR